MSRNTGHPYVGRYPMGAAMQLILAFIGVVAHRCTVYKPKGGVTVDLVSEWTQSSHE